LHPDFERDWLKSDESFDASKEGFFKNVIQPKNEFLSLVYLNQLGYYSDVKLKQLSFVLEVSKATKESEEKRTKNQVTYLDFLKTQKENFKKGNFYKLFKLIFPSSNHTSTLDNKTLNQGFKNNIAVTVDKDQLVKREEKMKAIIKAFTGSSN